MESLFSEQIFRAYNPWWDDGSLGTLKPPDFRRLVFKRLYKSVTDDRRIIVITGPRRVGKTTLIRQIIEQLLESGTTPSDIISFAMDDPSVLSSDPEEILNRIVGSKPNELKYIFLDEVQYLPLWEKYLKRYYDLNWPVKFVVSGSAATPIFRSSRESLLGRSIDYEIPPFTFVEFIGVKNIDAYEDTLLKISAFYPDITDEIKKFYTLIGKHKPSSEPNQYLVEDYFVEGGFPEAWGIEDPIEKTDYILTNQVEKVIFNDLALTEDIRKPEAMKKLCYVLYSNPGRENNLTSISKDLGVNRNTVDTYLSLMLRTNLISKIEKFGYGENSLKRSNFKTYIADFSLRNAIMQIDSIDDLRPEDLGYYAENAVYNLLKRRKDMTAISFYKDKRRNEVDFILDTGIKDYIPVEVKYREGRIKFNDLKGMEIFTRRYNPKACVIITKNDLRFIEPNTYFIPLNFFLWFFERGAF